MTLWFRRAGIGAALVRLRVAKDNLFAATRARGGPVGNFLGNVDTDVAPGTNNGHEGFVARRIAGGSRNANRFLARGTMDQGPLHPGGNHQPLAAPGTLMDIQRRGRVDRCPAVRTLDRQAAAGLIDDEMTPADWTGKKDIGHSVDLDTPASHGNRRCAMGC